MSQGTVSLVLHCLQVKRTHLFIDCLDWFEVLKKSMILAFYMPTEPLNLEFFMRDHQLYELENLVFRSLLLLLGRLLRQG